MTRSRGADAPAPRPLELLRMDTDVVEALAEGASLASLPIVEDAGRPVRANLHLDAGVLAAIDATASRLGETRSAVVELLARRALPQLG